MVADISSIAASDALAECQAVAKNPEFRGESIQVDITLEESVAKLFRETAEAFGQIDYCVNAAGVSGSPETN